MKTLYFVRHGESEGNVGPIFQDTKTALTQKGKEQAKFIAKRVAGLPIELIISSPYTRTKQTTDAIIKKLSQPPLEYSDLFVERGRPSCISGKPKDDPKAKEAEESIKNHFHEPGYRHSDEENFDDLKLRAQKALLYLESKSQNTILVVTHGFFMRIVLASIIFKEKLTGDLCQNIIRTVHMENTGLTVLTYDEHNGRWILDVWNDYAHLGEVK